MVKHKLLLISIPVAVILSLLLLAACAGPAGSKGDAGPAGAPGVSTGTLSGKVTNSLTNGGVAGVAVTVEPAVQGVNITTDANGAYTGTLPVGVYTVNYKKDNFNAGKETVSVIGGQTAAKNVVLKPVKAVVVSAATQAGKPGDTVTLKATAVALDGSTVSGYKWEQTAGAKVTVDNANSDTIKVTLPNVATFKNQILSGLELLDRWVVQAINPHALIAAETVTFKITATTSAGTTTGTGTINVSLPYTFSAGIQDVPQGVAVLLHGKKQAAYNWSIAGPSGSKAALDSATDQNPSFTPDMVGKYTISEKTSSANIDVYAGTWAGAITGQDKNGRPLAAACTACHDGKTAPDNFTAWAKSGHAEIFTQNINNPDGHWAITCAECHTVGYNPDATNGGFDEAVKAESWQVPPHGDVGLWTTMLSKFPKTTKLANIQCENCHGPNEGTGLHMDKQINPARVSISSDVCGACHGEPLRHGRYQQWEESGHGNFELAIDDATVEARGATAAHCGRCHTGQGFLAWSQQGDLTKQIQGKNGNATVAELTAMGLTKDKVQPQTCVVCHDPHDPGNTSTTSPTAQTNATVRIMGDTAMLPAGYQAKDVGKGAICITCHNTRNGAHNDNAPANAPTGYSAPHTAAQGDVLMGENAYFVSVPERSPHANLDNTCVTCHMEKTPAPPEFSMPGVGTNHGFKASIDICSKCHSDTLNGKGLQEGNEAKIEALAQKMSGYLLKKMPTQITTLDYTYPHTYGGKSYD
ncbi:MAG: hypothetical protein Q7R57_03475, partial [Dehalococcoidales bacterium]|nr:hypothetical protein [Dehalococcoidales bacterium]